MLAWLVSWQWAVDVTAKELWLVLVLCFRNSLCCQCWQLTWRASSINVKKSRSPCGSFLGSTEETGFSLTSLLLLLSACCSVRFSPADPCLFMFVYLPPLCGSLNFSTRQLNLLPSNNFSVPAPPLLSPPSNLRGSVVSSGGRGWWIYGPTVALKRRLSERYRLAEFTVGFHRFFIFLPSVLPAISARVCKNVKHVAGERDVRALDAEPKINN